MMVIATIVILRLSNYTDLIPGTLPHHAIPIKMGAVPYRIFYGFCTGLRFAVTIPRSRYFFVNAGNLGVRPENWTGHQH